MPGDERSCQLRACQSEAGLGRIPHLLTRRIPETGSSRVLASTNRTQSHSTTAVNRTNRLLASSHWQNDNLTRDRNPMGNKGSTNKNHSYWNATTIFVWCFVVIEAVGILWILSSR